MWEEIIRKVLQLPPHVDITVPKTIDLPDIVLPAVGEPRGQRMDWEILLENGGRIHIREYDDVYKIHWDLISPKVDPIKHIRIDSPHWYELLSLFLMKTRELYKERGVNK